MGLIEQIEQKIIDTKEARQILKLDAYDDVVNDFEALISLTRQQQIDLEVNKGFYNVVVAERKLAWQQIESLQKENERWNQLRPEVQWFAVQMESALKANDHKGGWKECTDFYLLTRMKEEKLEVSYSLFIENRSESEVIKECADVANFAMMIADNAHIQEGANK